MSNRYKLEKAVWDERDFEKMGWNNVAIHAIAFGPGEFELSFDIDYIFMFLWVHSPEGEKYLKFWVSPCTLVFENVHDLDLDFNPYGQHRLEMNFIERSDPRKPLNAEHTGKDVEWEWTIACHNGEVVFRSVGFRQYVRRAPVLSSAQYFELEERGGYSFEQGEDLES